MAMVVPSGQRDLKAGRLAPGISQWDWSAVAKIDVRLPLPYAEEQLRFTFVLGQWLLQSYAAVGDGAIHGKKPSDWFGHTAQYLLGCGGICSVLLASQDSAGAQDFHHLSRKKVVESIHRRAIQLERIAVQACNPIKKTRVVVAPNRSEEQTSE